MHENLEFHVKEAYFNRSLTAVPYACFSSKEENGTTPSLPGAPPPYNLYLRYSGSGCFFCDRYN